MYSKALRYFGISDPETDRAEEGSVMPETHVSRGVATDDNLLARYESLEQSYSQATHHIESLSKQNKSLLQKIDQLQLRLQSATEEGKTRYQDYIQAESGRQAAQSENSRLHEHITNLKSLISTASRGNDDLADDEIQRKCDNVFYLIQGFVANNFRGVEYGLLRPVPPVTF